jgi:hypothetical protein
VAGAPGAPPDLHLHPVLGRAPREASGKAGDGSGEGCQEVGEGCLALGDGGQRRGGEGVKFPADMTPEEFFRLPVNDGPPRLQPLRARTDTTGFVDAQGWAWIWVLMDEGYYARQRAFSL